MAEETRKEYLDMAQGEIKAGSGDPVLNANKQSDIRSEDLKKVTFNDYPLYGT